MSAPAVLPLRTSNFGRLYHERAYVLRSLSCAIKKGENTEMKLNEIKRKLASGEDEACSKKTMKKRVRTLSYQMTQCRKVEDTLTANLNIITEQIDYVEQHQRNNFQQSYANHSELCSQQPPYEEYLNVLSPFVAFSPSFLTMLSPVPYSLDMSVTSFSPTMHSPASSSSASTTWSTWSDSYTSDISDPNSPRAWRFGMPVYPMQPSRSSSSDSWAPRSPSYSDYSPVNSIIWQNWSFGPSLLSAPQTPIDLVSPMTNLDINGVKLPFRPLPYSPESSPKPSPKRTLRRSKFQWRHENSTNEATSSVGSWKPRYTATSSALGTTIASDPAPLPKSNAHTIRAALSVEGYAAQVSSDVSMVRKRSTSQPRQLNTDMNRDSVPDRKWNRSRSWNGGKTKL